MDTQNSNPRLRDVIRNDIRQLHFIEKLRHDIQEIQNFYLSPQQKSLLKKMGFFRRTLRLTAWILKSMLLRLTPARRLLFLLALLFSFSFETHSNHQTFIINVSVFSLTCLVLILLLELKDKLLARNELDAGRKVQLALMPASSPLIPGWDVYLKTIPANDVGGDLVDYLRQNSSHLLSIADVAGKGLSAALVTSKLQATLRALASYCTSLEELCTKINEIFVRDRLPASFASLLMLRIEEQNPALSFVNAGHLPPLLRHANTCEELQKGGQALGLTSTASYFAQTITMSPGDILLIYSDGIPDAQNENGDFFGTEQLIKFLTHHPPATAEQIASSLLAEIRRFIGQTSPTDDISLIVIRRT